jgi:meso-butanediol dehydrogenase / (S,S)-butanediol dehydrogenase / diacetyl reductase
MRLANRVALITGGGSGIGQAIAYLFAKEGAKIVASDRYLERAEATVAKIRDDGGDALALKADVSSQAEVNAMAESALATYGKVDILVNNAAISRGDDILTIDEATWDLNINIVLKGVYLCSKALLPNMLANKRGAIINISSVNGLTGIGEEAYSAAKAAVLNLTQNMAVRYGPKQVRVNAICPGSIRTPIWAERVAIEPDIFNKLAKWYPLGRVGQPEDIARAALFLASDDASWITGATLNVDGGLMAGRGTFGDDLLGQ